MDKFAKLCDANFALYTLLFSMGGKNTRLKYSVVVVDNR